jgi:hypothetical protein
VRQPLNSHAAAACAEDVSNLKKQPGLGPAKARYGPLLFDLFCLSRHLPECSSCIGKMKNNEDIIIIIDSNKPKMLLIRTIRDFRQGRNV